LAILNSHLPLILRSFGEARETVSSNKSIGKVLCSTLNFHRNFIRFGGKINPKDKEAISNVLLQEMNNQLVEHLVSRKKEILLRDTDALVMVLKRIPAEMWMNDFPEIRIYEA